MEIQFYKYQGAGNDFVMIDDRKRFFPVDQKIISRICDRHFGVGADGLILLQEDNSLDFNMVYFNSDGRPSSMCGNGGRCVVRFAQRLGLIEDETEFNAIDGVHRAVIDVENIQLKMSDVTAVEVNDGFVFLNTGSPHHIEFVNDVKSIDVKQRGAVIRYGSPYFEKGSNVNFVEIKDEDSLVVRTYERGVEDETLACGTGVTAAAIAAFETGKVKNETVKVQAMGGKLAVSFKKNESAVYENIWLTGPAEFVFEGKIKI